MPSRGFGRQSGLWGCPWCMVGRGPTAADPHDLSMVLLQGAIGPSVCRAQASGRVVILGTSVTVLTVEVLRVREGARLTGASLRQTSARLVLPGGCGDSRAPPSGGSESRSTTAARLVRGCVCIPRTGARTSPSDLSLVVLCGPGGWPPRVRSSRCELGYFPTKGPVFLGLSAGLLRCQFRARGAQSRSLPCSPDPGPDIPSGRGSLSWQGCPLSLLEGPGRFPGDGAEEE